MNNYDLSRVGIDKSIIICGSLEFIGTTIPSLPTIFLFDENHENNECINDNIENAKELINKASVDLVGVESYFGGQVWDEINSKYLNDFYDDQIVIEEDEYKRFANTLIEEYPQKVFGVDSSEMHTKLSKDLVSINSNYYGKKVSQHPLNEMRSRHFVKTLFELYKCKNLNGNLILNAGGNHNTDITKFVINDIIKSIANMNANYVRITSPYYK